MHWHTKATIQRVLSLLPGGESLNYMLQRHITKTLPQPPEKFRAVFDIEAKHIHAFNTYGTRPVEDAVFFQFGAGWTMAGPLTFTSFGVRKQILVDIRRLIRPWLINASITRLQEINKAYELPHVPDRFVSNDADQAVQEMSDWWGIDYRAPSDARWTGLPDNSVDCITSTNTLEHIPKDDIREIMRECHRILRPGGVMSFQVDYQDHYSYFDKSVSVYNYLQFSDAEWKSFNPSLHYQNRLRHSDYLSLYREAGFETTHDTPREGSEEDLQLLTNLQINDRYHGYSKEDLAIRSSHIILTKPAAAATQSHPQQKVA